MFTPDDELTVRDEREAVARDNVLFELGLFIGKLSRFRAFLIHSSDQPIALPSDLAGMTTATYQSNATNLSAAIGPACQAIRDASNKAEKANAKLPGLAEQEVNTHMTDVVRLIKSDIPQVDLKQDYKDKTISELKEKIKNLEIETRQVGLDPLDLCKPTQVQDQYRSILEMRNGDEVTELPKDHPCDIRNPNVQSIYSLLPIIKNVDKEFKELYYYGFLTSKTATESVWQKGRKIGMAIEERLGEFTRNVLSEMEHPPKKNTLSIIDGYHSTISPEAKQYCFFIDLVDGSRHVQRALPMLTTSIALGELRTFNNNEFYEPTVALIYSPVTRELFFSIRHCGTFLNNWQNKLEVSKSPLKNPDNEDSGPYIYVEFPNSKLCRYDKESFDRWIPYLNNIMADAYRIRGMGLGSLGLAYVAGGKMGAYLDFSGTTGTWDVAAGLLMVQEAGGYVFRFPKMTKLTIRFVAWQPT